MTLINRIKHYIIQIFKPKQVISYLTDLDRYGFIYIIDIHNQIHSHSIDKIIIDQISYYNFELYIVIGEEPNKNNYRSNVVENHYGYIHFDWRRTTFSTCVQEHQNVWEALNKNFIFKDKQSAVDVRNDLLLKDMERLSNKIKDE